MLHQEGPKTLTKETRFSGIFKEGILADNLATNTSLRDSLLSFSKPPTTRDLRKLIHKVLNGGVSEYQIDVILSVVNGGTLPSLEATCDMPDYMIRIKDRVVLRRWGHRPSEGRSDDSLPDWVWWKDSDVKDLDYESLYLQVQDAAIEKANSLKEKKIVPRGPGGK